MTTQNALPLFYKKPEPLDAEKHRNLALRNNFGLKFTSKVNAVPITMIEMPQICHTYPIAFSPDAGATPVAILGLKDNENLYLKEDGNWEKIAISRPISVATRSFFQNIRKTIN